MEQVLKYCNNCNQAALFKPLVKNRKPLVKPIIPTGTMDKLVIDLMDFIKKPNNNKNQIMQLKFFFPKYYQGSVYEFKDTISTSNILEQQFSLYNKIKYI